MQGINRRLGRIFDRISHGNHGGQFSINRSVQRRLAFIAQATRLSGKVIHIQAQFAHEAISTDLNLGTIHFGAHAKAGDRFKRLHRRNAQAFGLGRIHNGACNRVLAAVFHRSHLRQHGGTLKASSQHQIGQLGATLGQRAGLVHRHHLGVFELLQGFTLAQQHAHLRGAACAHHDGGRCGQAHSAGAGNDEHRHGIDQCKAQSGRRAPDQPHGKGEQGRRHDSGHKPHGDLVDQCLNRQLAALRLLHHADDLRQQRIGAHLGGFKRQRAVLVDGAAHHFGTGGFLHRHGLAADHGLVHKALTFGHHAIDRNALTRTHLNHIAGTHLGNIQLLHTTGTAHARRLGLQLHQAANRFRRIAFGMRFQKAAQQNQCHDDGCGFVIHIHRARRQQLRRKRGHQRIGEGSRGTHSYQRVHIRRAAQQGWHAFLKKAPPWAKQHQRRQHTLYVPAVLRANGLRNPVVKGRHHVAAHLQKKDGQGKHGGKNQRAFERLTLRCLASGGGVFHGRTGLALHHGRSLVAGLGNRSNQAADIRAFRHLHTGALGRQVHAGGLHAGHLLQSPLHTPHARRASHAIDLQIHALLRHHVAGLFNRRHNCWQNGRGLRRILKLQAGFFSGQIDHGILYTGHFLQGPLHTPYAGRACHPFYRQLESAVFRQCIHCVLHSLCMQL